MENVKNVSNPNGLWDGQNGVFTQREPCVEKCIGCDKQLIDENQVLPVCNAYLYPSLKWKDHKSKTITKKIKGKDTEMVLHFNPCPLASHAKHELSQEEARKINPLKASKRRSR